MTGSGGRSGRSEWERRQAAQRREAERQARESVRKAKEQERERQRRHLERQQSKTESKTADIGQRIEQLDTVLTSVLPVPPLSFSHLGAAEVIPAFKPGALAVPAEPPDWRAFEPAPLTGLKRLWGTGRYEQDYALARQRYDAAEADHQQREHQRLQDLAVAQAEHDRQVAEARERASAENALVGAMRAGFDTGQPEAVEWFVRQVLDTSQYPKGFPRRYEIAYRPQNHDLVVEFELPPQKIIPEIRGYKYVKTRDAIDPIPRPQTEIKQRYARLIAAVALRTLHEIFLATPDWMVEAVVFNGRLSTTDRSTGKKVRPHLLSVEAERSAFEGLVLAEVDPALCLKRLNALVSPNPYDLEAIEPFITFDLNRFRFSDDLDVVAGLDSRRNLLQLSPTEFEHLVRELFIAMGAEAWTTIPSKDGGVDAVATSDNLFFGGVCLIQAKRWKGLVGLDAVHALTGVMADHNATTGVLVTPSWFGRASEQFAQRNRITLINGAELKHLIKKHLNIDVIPGTTPPRNARASDNTQTGRPGPR